MSYDPNDYEENPVEEETPPAADHHDSDQIESDDVIDNEEGDPVY